MSYPSTEGSFRLPEPSRAQRTVQNGSKSHFTGQIVTGDGPGRVVGLESHLELKWFLLLQARPNTVEINEQVASIWTDKAGRRRNHYVDFVVVQSDGRRVGYAIRPMIRVTEDYLDELGRVKSDAVRSGRLDDLRLLTDEHIHPVDLFNATLKHGVREPDPEADGAARAVVAAMAGVASLGELTDRIALDGRGYRALIRLVNSGHLQPVRNERLLKSADVFKSENAKWN